ncbi:MAG: NAD(P)H-dependent oxidoreductase, partial [Anaerolineales bacterium]
MIIVDKLLSERQQSRKPIRVAMVGAGVVGKGLARQITNYVEGMDLVAISNRSLSSAEQAYHEAGVGDVLVVEHADQLQDAIEQGRPAVTENVTALYGAEGIDVVVEATGSFEFAASVGFETIQNKKHFVTVNAEMDGTVGPILKAYADKAGVMYTNSDGDQPGVVMNLYRSVQGMGLRPVMCGNIKGLQDPYRNPTTQEGFAKKWGIKAFMAASFADGTKISFEQGITANATGMRVAKRGMHGPSVKSGTPIEETVHLFPLEDMLEGPGIVDYVIGAAPGPGVFLLATTEDPVLKHYLNMYKMGEGPLYCFYRPFHLCHIEVPSTIARAVLLNDATIAPLGAPTVEVISTAKIDLEAGQTLDGLGGYTLYGQLENADVARAQKLLPFGVAEGCKMKRNLSRDEVLTYDDVELPEGRLIDKLRTEQETLFT